ncbi:MAG: hypothetical protein NUV84_05285 [Candidatus Uhrbacteria bacterium]|nr:hypothetical protein [Candidatus Uhrbacteria bacterium]
MGTKQLILTWLLVGFFAGLLFRNRGAQEEVNLHMDSPTAVLQEATSTPPRLQEPQAADLSVEILTTQKDLAPQVKREIRLVWRQVKMYQEGSRGDAWRIEDPTRLWLSGDPGAPGGIDSIPVTVSCTRNACEAELPSGRRVTQPVIPELLVREPLVRAAALAALRCVSPLHAFQYILGADLPEGARRRVIEEMWSAEDRSDTAFLRPDGTMDSITKNLVRGIK